MNDSIIQLAAENKILAYKLDKIRNYIHNRMEMVDPITKNELNIILTFISNYEHVDTDWTLTNALVNIPEGDDK